MRMRRLFVLIAILLASPVPQTRAAPADGLDAEIATIAAGLMARHDIAGLAIGVTAPGVRRLYYHGVADRRSARPVNAATLFEIGSLSKTYTAALGAYAAETGQLDLSEPAGKLRPALAGSALGQASLLQLATYTAGGLPLQFPDEVQTPAEAERYYQGFSPAFPPGSRRQYSNPSIGLFGDLAAGRLGEPFAAALRRHVLGPLGLVHTHLQVPEAQQVNYAWGDAKDNRPVRAAPGMYDEQAYGIKTTAGDLLAYVEAHLEPDGFAAPLARALCATRAGHYRVGPMVQGLGWELYPEPVSLEDLLAGNRLEMALQAQAAERLAPPRPASAAGWVNKTGSTNGFGAYAVFIPERRIGVVILANRNYPIPARIEAAYRIVRQGLTALPPSPPACRSSSLPAAR